MHPPPTPEEHRHKVFPIGLITSCRKLLIIGGSFETHARVMHARQFDWLSVLVILKEDDQEVTDMAIGDSRMVVTVRPVEEADIAGADLVVEDSGDLAIARKVSAWCSKHRKMLNSVDKPEFCDVYYMSLLFRGPMLLSITSSGEAPALSAALRRHLDHAIGPGWVRAAALFADLRSRLPSGQARIDLLKSLSRNSDLLACIERNDVEGMGKFFDDAFARFGT